MRRDIPDQLKITDFRFYLIRSNAKIPIEKKWNTANCYMFFEKRLQDHINSGGNVGICTGYGGLIVVDFDSDKFQKSKESMLPGTFTVKTAIKGLKHFYYILEGEMISKIGIDVDGSRVADIQAGKDGVTCPPSSIGEKPYSVVSDMPIATITCKQISDIFGVDRYRQSKRRVDTQNEVHPKKIQDAIDYFRKIGIPNTNARHFRCPFHMMNGNGNLYVFDDGSIHCFHCLRHFNDAADFRRVWEGINGGIVIK